MAYRTFLIAMTFVLGLASSAMAQQVTTASGGILRVLDKTTGRVSDVEMSTGETTDEGRLEITMSECRYPTGNPSGNAYVNLTIMVQGYDEPLFRGWMIASAPALNAMEHPRYDVWVLRCKTS
jgi:hypothetical protein